MKKTRIVFLDRDGVINRNPVYFDYVKSPEEFKFIPGVCKAIKMLNGAGYKVAIISNQTGVGKGYYSKQNLKNIGKKMIKGLDKSGARLDSINYCIHHPDSNCGCRKPKIGLIKKAVRHLKIDKKNSFFVGDTERDAIAGTRYGVKTVTVLSGYNNRKDIKGWNTKPDFIAKNLLEAVEKVVLAHSS